jgi:RNA-directed DNA polymerase
MGILGWLLRGSGHGIEELARRLDIGPERLRQFEPSYREFFIPKRSGGKRRILAPDNELKALQRRILRRLLARLRSHPAAMGFERGRSIVTNALAHQRQAIVMSLDVKDFFTSTTARRVHRYFRRIGWNRPAAKLLVRLCTHGDGLPQGAPTSPRLSNLMDYRLDARLAGMATRLGAIYTRYADDVTFSFADAASARVNLLRKFARRVFRENGYTLHRRKKARVRRRHHRQMVTGLVVNDRVNLPRETRRRLRAIEHRWAVQQAAADVPLGSVDLHRRKRPTMGRSELEGWRALRSMIEQQTREA